MGFSMRKSASEMAPYASMVFAQLSSGGYVVLSKVMLLQGTSSTVFLAYQFIITSIFMSTLSLIFERSNRPPLTKSTAFKIFLLSFLGFTFSMNLLSGCLYFISSTIEAAVLNLIPVFTFFLSIISRQEKLGINTLWGQGKLFGTLLSVSGALLLIFWHGSPLRLRSTSTVHWVLGLVMVLFGVLGYSTWILLLRPVTKKYPAQISLNALMFFSATLQGLVVAAIATPKPSKWQLKWDLELLNIFFGAICYNGLSNLFITWCASKKGPIFVASFSPLGMVFTTILEVIFLGEALHIGSVVGILVIIAGLYMLLWAKAKEEAYYLIDEEDPLISSLIS